MLIQYPAEHQPGNIRQHQIQQDHIGRLLVREAKTLGPIRRNSESAVLPFQVELDQLGKLRIIVHQQNARFHSIVRVDLEGYYCMASV